MNVLCRGIKLVIVITSTMNGMLRKMVWHWDSAFGRRIISNGLYMIFTSKLTLRLRKEIQIKVCIRSNAETKIVNEGCMHREC
jgi:hypothetical protein